MQMQKTQLFINQIVVFFVMYLDLPIKPVWICLIYQVAIIW